MGARGRWTLTCVIAVGMIPSLVYAGLIWQSFPSDIFAPTRALVVRDFVNLSAGGTLALAGRLDTLFDPVAYYDWLKSAYGPRLDLHTWSYPPPMLLIAIPFAALPLVPGFLLWTLASLAFLGLVLRRAGLRAPLVAAIILSPAALENALAGQNGAVMAAALAGGLLMARSRPLAAGALLGLLVLKPQLGLLVPVALLAGREWRTIAWTAAFAAGYVVVSLLAFGPEAWRGFLGQTAPFMTAIMEAPFGLGFQMQMPPPFITARAAGASLGLAYAVQAVASTGCMLLTAAAWAAKGDSDLRLLAVALTLLLVPLASPYAHSYDMVCCAAGIALLADRLHAEDRLGRPEFYSLGLAWIWPGIAFVFGAAIAPGLGPLVMAPAILCAAGAVMRRVRAARDTRAEAA